MNTPLIRIYEQPVRLFKSCSNANNVSFDIKFIAFNLIMSGKYEMNREIISTARTVLRLPCNIQELAIFKVE